MSNAKILTITATGDCKVTAVTLRNGTRVPMVPVRPSPEGQFASVGVHSG